ncbi:type II toxin-antitoxin system Phd/YefM family antitoxin [Porticoccaceae bacterium]|nr:type II toxin-antitoxin system Phd/YefM family antitoxin [Porticoccaceae bacterium]
MPRLVSTFKDSGRPVLLTSRGRGVAVVQGLEEYDRNGILQSGSG